MRKILALTLALIMILGLATTAFADDVDVSGHDFVAYQIFSGSQATDGGPLGDVQWGTGVNDVALLAALKTNTTLKDIFKDCVTAADVAAELAKYNSNPDIAKEFARVVYANKAGDGAVVEDGDTIDPGYYLIVDTTNVSGADDVLNLALLEVSSKVTIESKVEKPSSQKKVKDTNDTTGETTNWQDSADYDVNDEVPFQLKATLPGDVTSYNKYYLAFHDVQSAGLTFNAETVKVYVDDKQINSGYEVKTATADGCTFEIIIKDVRAVGASNESVITVEYTSTLNENAVIGSVGNPNKMNIEYSNNPNQIWDGEGKPDTGETPEDKVIVFTYKVVVNKVDGKKNPLAGAGFTLYKKNAEGVYEVIEEISVGTGDDENVFSFEGLDDGDYKLVETKTPAGYNTIADIEFTITAEHDILSDNPALTKLEGGVLFTGEVSTGALTGDVVNQAGTTLPETGGIGTTLFYVIGGLLVAAAVVLLVTKKRMASAQ